MRGYKKRLLLQTVKNLLHQELYLLTTNNSNIISSKPKFGISLNGLSIYFICDQMFKWAELREKQPTSPDIIVSSYSVSIRFFLSYISMFCPWLLRFDIAFRNYQNDGLESIRRSSLLIPLLRLYFLLVYPKHSYQNQKHRKENPQQIGIKYCCKKVS